VFVLDIAGTKMLFPGDAQWGLWDAIVADPTNGPILAGTRIYKVGHHGSHNATHKRYVQQLMGDNVTSMMSFHTVKDWPSIPNPRLVDALSKRPRTLVRSDEQRGRRGLKWNGTISAEMTIVAT
jgi:beta-lactamase superfamily II metal-dependent hydrolase